MLFFLIPNELSSSIFMDLDTSPPHGLLNFESNGVTETEHAILKLVVLWFGLRTFLVT